MLAENPVIPFDITWESRLKSALERLAKNAFELVVLDLGLPDSSGLDTLCEIRNHVPETAIVVMTGLNDEQIGVRAVQESAQDYLVKGQVEGYSLSRFLLYAVERKKNEKKIAHLNQVLRMFIRNVNQLIVKEKDRDPLLTKTCENLTGTRRYKHAWIILFDHTNTVTTSFQE